MGVLWATLAAAAAMGSVVHPDQLSGDGTHPLPRPARLAPVIGEPPQTVQDKSGKTVQNGLRSTDYEYVLGDGVTAKNVVYFSEGVACYGKVFYPKGFDPTARPGIPAVVLGQGYAGNHISIEKYANRFAERGLVAMVIDYRGWGFSEAIPELVTPVIGGGTERDNVRFTVKAVKVRLKRTQISPQMQQQDYRNAISWIQGEPGVDYQRIGVWGSSLAGGNATVVAGQDGRVKAISVQVPAITGQPTIRGRVPVYGPARADAIKRARVGQGGEFVTGFSRLFAVDEYVQARDFQENAVAFWASKLGNTPFQAVAAEKDQLIPVEGVKATVDRMTGPHNLVVVPDISHFEMYSHEPFEISANAAADWFVKYLNAPEAADGPEPIAPPRALTPLVRPGPAKSRHRGAAKGSTAN